MYQNLNFHKLNANFDGKDNDVTSIYQPYNYPYKLLQRQLPINN